ncbi:uncharacterized protein KZ484_025136 [Pholidichthys leucotaenia]
MMTSMIEMAKRGPADGSTKASDSRNEQPDIMNQDSASSNETPPATNSDLDPTMRRLLIQAELTEQDFKDKDIAEAVDCIISKFGGLKAVQRELRGRGPVSQTLPRTAGSSISLALKKGPLPPLPSIRDSATSGQAPQGKGALTKSQTDSWTYSLSSAPATEKIRKSASFTNMCSERGDFLLTSLREVFKQKQMLQRAENEDGDHLDPQ